jgi:transcriptional regulator with XRE-family HTH domain
MPRRNLERFLRSEESLARRIGYEREVRGWTYEGLAKRMTDAGCAINASALYKIEKSEPRRRITVDELVALAQVLEVDDLDDLLQPPEAVLHRELRARLDAMFRAADATLRVDRAYKAALRDLAAYAEAHPEVVDELDAAGFSLAELIETLSDSDEDVDRRFAARLDRLGKERRGGEYQEEG